MGNAKHLANKSCFDGWDFGNDPEGFHLIPSGREGIPTDWLTECFESFMDFVLDDTWVFFMDIYYSELTNRKHPLSAGPHPLDMFIQFGANGADRGEVGPMYMFNIKDELRPYMQDDEYSGPLKEISKALKDLAETIDENLPDQNQ